MDFGKGVLNPSYGLRPVGKVFMAEYAKFIADKNVKLGSAGQLEAVPS
jgi:fructose-bisphosphate aldolase class II